MMMKNQNGITLITLIITIVVMLILANVSVKNVTDSIESTRLEAFYMQLEIIQKRVDDIVSTNEKYINDDGNEIYLKQQGSGLTDEQKSSLQDILNAEKIKVDIGDFRYFTISDLETILDLMEIDYNVFINFEKRLVIAEEGIKVKEKTYYVLRDTTYFVEHIDKNVGKIESLNYSTPIKYGENMYKIEVTPSKTIGDVAGTGYVKYKKVSTKYWETSSNSEVVLETDVEYDIKYIDPNNNSIDKIIKLEKVQDENNNSIVTVIEISKEESEEE